MHQLWGRHLVAATGAFRRRSSRPPATVPEDRIVTLKLALSDYTFPKLEWEKVLRLARDLSVEAVDIGLFAGRSHLRPEDVLGHPAQAAARVAQALRTYVLEIAVRCNARHLSLLPGIHFVEESYEDSLKRCADELAWRVEAAARVGVIFAVEMHLGSIAPTPPQAQRLLQMTPGLTLTLDYTHFTCQGIP